MIRDYCFEQVDCDVCGVCGFCYKYLRVTNLNHLSVPMDWDVPEEDDAFRTGSAK